MLLKPYLKMEVSFSYLYGTNPQNKQTSWGMQREEVICDERERLRGGGRGRGETRARTQCIWLSWMCKGMYLFTLTCLLETAASV